MLVRNMMGLLLRTTQILTFRNMGYNPSYRRQFLQACLLLLLMSPNVLQAEIQGDHKKMQYASFDGKLALK